MGCSTSVYASVTEEESVHRLRRLSMMKFLRSRLKYIGNCPCNDEECELSTRRAQMYNKFYYGKLRGVRTLRKFINLGRVYANKLPTPDNPENGHFICHYINKICLPLLITLQYNLLNIIVSRLRIDFPKHKCGCSDICEAVKMITLYGNIQMIKNILPMAVLPPCGILCEMIDHEVYSNSFVLELLQLFKEQPCGVMIAQLCYK